MNIMETGKNSTDESICKVEIETQTQRTNIQTQVWGDGGITGRRLYGTPRMK